MKTLLSKNSIQKLRPQLRCTIPCKKYVSTNAAKLHFHKPIFHSPERVYSRRCFHKTNGIDCGSQKGTQKRPERPSYKLPVANHPAIDHRLEEINQSKLKLFNKQSLIPVDIPYLLLQARFLHEKLGFKDYKVELNLVTDGKMAHLNHIFRLKNRPTDVLSFPFHEHIRPPHKPPSVDGHCILGEIYIGMEYCTRICIERNVLLHEHLPILIAHGLLHLLGHNHDHDAEFELMQTLQDDMVHSLFAFQSEIHPYIPFPQIDPKKFKKKRHKVINTGT